MGKWFKQISVFGLTLLLVFSAAADEFGATPITTEFQVVLQDQHKFEQVSDTLQLADRKFKIETIQFFHANDLFEKYGIKVRFTDKNDDVEFTIKFNFPYSPYMVNLLSQHFPNEKKEINRHRNEAGTLELTFRNEMNKNALGLAEDESLTCDQILAQMKVLVTRVRNGVSNLAARDTCIGTEECRQPDPYIEAVRSKLVLLTSTNPDLWTSSSATQRQKWKIKSDEFSKIIVEKKLRSNSSLEISTRVTGDVKDPKFFDYLKSIGLSI